jgi:hypothetical protein
MKGLSLLGLVLLGACAAEKATGPGLAVGDLAGSWTVMRWQRVSEANTAERADVLPNAGTASLEVTAAGEFNLTVVVPGQGTSSETGTLAISGDSLTYDGQNDAVLFRITGGGDAMAWRALETELNDVNNDRVPEDTNEEVEYARR